MNSHYVSIFRRCELSYIRSELERFGLIPLEGRVIRMLKEHCGIQENLAECLNIDKGRIAKTISMLEEKGLVCRVVNEKNRRQKIVSLTETGVQMYESICDVYRAWDKICYKGFSKEEIEMHQQFIRRISQNAVEHRKKNGGKLNG